MNRREFLLLRTAADRVEELSGERLYMRYVDAEADGTTARLFEMLARDLDNARAVRLTDTSWLAHEDLKQRLDTLLSGFVSRGGKVVGSGGTP